VRQDCHRDYEYRLSACGRNKLSSSVTAFAFPRNSYPTTIRKEMDLGIQCLGCQIIGEAMTSWSNGLIGDTFEVPLGTFAGFEERTNCKVCQFVVQHFKVDPMCHPFRPSCSLMFSRISFNERFWIEPVSFA
jgi:hypothetical protein